LRRRQVRVEFRLQSLGAARSAQRDFPWRNALDAPPTYGITFGNLQRLVATDREYRDTVVAHRNDPGESGIGEIAVTRRCSGVLRRSAGTAEKRASENSANEFLGSSILLANCRARRIGPCRRSIDHRIFRPGGSEFDEEDRAEHQASRNQQQRREAIDHCFAATGFSPSR